MLKLNTTRTFSSAVTVHFVSEEGRAEKGDMKAVFKVMPTDQLQDEGNSDKRLLDLVLVSVSNIELADEEGNTLEGAALVDACKNDPSISSALVATYSEKLTKKNQKRI